MKDIENATWHLKCFAIKMNDILNVIVSEKIHPTFEIFTMVITVKCPLQNAIINMLPFQNAEDKSA